MKDPAISTTDVIKFFDETQNAPQTHRYEYLNLGKVDQASAALRFNDGKLKWSLVHYGALEPLVRVLMFGAKKYAPNNWKRGLDRSEILESMQRHLSALMDGEENDKESKLSHMGHLMCNAMFYNYFYVLNNAPSNDQSQES